MKIHSDIIIFEILKLYFEATNETSISINTLKNGFYTLNSIVSAKNNIEIVLNFESELEKFLDKYHDYFNLKDNKLEITEEIGIIYNAIIDSHTKLSVLDFELQEDIFDINLYNALNIPIPLNEMQEYFELNKELIRIFLKLGENEFYHYYDRLEFERLYQVTNELFEKLTNADNSTLTKLRICFNYLDDKFLPNTAEPHNNSAWNTILFSNNPLYLYSLSYDYIEFLVNIIDSEADEESEEILNEFFDSEYNSTEKLSDISYFLTIFLLELEKYLKDNPNTKAHEALLIKKYLLISTPELKHIKKYFLVNHNFDNYPEPPIPEDLNPDSFEQLKNKVLECTTYLVANNQELTKPHILGKVISATLFIKTYLEVSINPNSINDILNLIENSLFYKKSGYETITSIVDKIIFNDSPNLQR